MGRFQNNFTGMFLGWPFTTIAKMVLLHWTKGPPELKIEKTPITTSSPRPMGWFQNNFTEMFLGWPSTKIAKMVLLRWTKWPSKLKIEKPFKRHLLLGQWADSKIILQECFFTKIAKMVLLGWTKWPPELKIEKLLKRHLLQGQWAHFKIISYEWSPDATYQKLLKWFCSAEQNGHQS